MLFINDSELVFRGVITYKHIVNICFAYLHVEAVDLIIGLYWN